MLPSSPTFSDFWEYEGCKFLIIFSLYSVEHNIHVLFFLSSKTNIIPEKEIGTKYLLSHSFMSETLDEQNDSESFFTFRDKQIRSIKYLF